jgi:hypothetical protein
VETKTAIHVLFQEDPERQMYNIAATLLSCDIETCIFINLFDGIAWKVSCSNKEELVKEFVAAVLK